MLKNITYLNSNTDYEVLYDYENEFELPFFNYDFWKDRIDHNIRIKINVKVKDDIEIYNVGLQCYTKIIECPIFLYLSNTKYIRMEECNKIIILMKDKILIHNGVLENFDFLKLKVVKDVIFLKNKIIKVNIDTKKKW